ncbi:MAG: rRNA maturation RNase YbeY [Anaerolineae bacterium]|nr:rRNA maturation RNase YbeY [Anaerolineae bacterium]
MEIIIQINEPFAKNVGPELLEQAAHTTLHHCAPPPETKTVSVVITDSQIVRQLNHQFRGIDAPTDVLSFANTPDPDFYPGETTTHLGDVVIAYPVAEVQALSAGHTGPEEIILLAVHGLLHLLGFDHDTSADKNKMWAIQREIMAELGLAHLEPTEDEEI